MATQELVEAQPRPTDEARSKNAARRVRRSGNIPAVVYGAKKESVAVTVNPKQISRILHSESGHNTVFDLKVGSEQSKAMIVDWQYEPIKGSLLHIDLKRIAMDKALRVKVPVQLTGVPEGVKTQGGILEQIVREVEIECLPSDIPDHIDVDVTPLVFGQVFRVSDLPHSGKLKFITDETQPVAHITSVKEVVEAAPAEAGAEVAAAPAEPEVIKKGKQETEEGAAPEAAAKPEGGKKAEGKKKE
ncbi:MAG TPA: 50S ribosomal protein L25 [Terriglobales bacterium]|jgi:large subunit ribosomal protein L25|nr:50S ribosomal protein L25 [Terriglobales bacterium]